MRACETIATASGRHASPCLRIARIVSLCLALSLGSACAGTTGHLAAASTRDFLLQDLSNAAPSQHVVGRSCIDLVVVVPLSMPNFGDAIEDALRQTGGQVLTGVRIGYELIYFPFVYGVACYVAEGDAR